MTCVYDNEKEDGRNEDGRAVQKIIWALGVLQEGFGDDLKRVTHKISNYVHALRAWNNNLFYPKPKLHNHQNTSRFTRAWRTSAVVVGPFMFWLTMLDVQ